MTGLVIQPRRIILFLIDAFLGIVSLYCAFLLRFDWEIPQSELALFFSLLPFVLIFRSVSYLYFGFYSRLWRYCGLEDMLQILKAVVTGSLLLIGAVFFYNRAIAVPRSIFLIDFGVLMFLIGGSRLAWRLWGEKQKQTTSQGKTGEMNILILGAGDTGSLLLNNLRKQLSHYVVRGFIDDDPKKLNTSLKGKKVLGSRHDIPRLVKVHEIKEILVAANNITSESLSEVVGICHESGVHCRMLVSVIDLATNEIHISRIKNIEISDLLGRSPVSLDVSAIKKMVHGKRVLVTGAAGSIGSELCQQLLEFEPATLVMLDRGENYLYELGVVLDGKTKGTELIFLFGCVTNREKMESIFLQYQPQLVFHAAAHKHVPLMEINADEAVKNNVHGTKVIADLCDEFSVEKFVLVSTDKVVNPTSVMGMTKKIAEQYVRHINEKSKTRFMAVRFGNVL
ncbi:MAG: polysaccharide biosynthesis protein, partial [Nitrospinales bacterium]